MELSALSVRRSATSAFAAAAVASVLSLSALGCNSDDSEDSAGDGATTSKVRTPDRVTTDKEGNVKVERGKPPRQVKAPGRSPGVPASAPRFVGQYSVKVSAGELERLGAPEGTDGTWELRLLDGAYNLFPSTGSVAGRLTVAGERMTFRQRGGCELPDPSAEASEVRRFGPPGVYRWELKGRALRFKAVRDPCADRRTQLSSLDWTLQL